jgi:hypothetical protein
MIVYRFFPETHALATLESGHLKVGRFLDFNDPFEFYPQNPLLTGRNGIIWEFHRDSFIKSAVGSRFGIVCFSSSRSIETPLLWSHYADSHRGIALGFEVSETVKSEKFLVSNRESITGCIKLHDVIYSGYKNQKNTRVLAESLTEISRDFEKLDEHDTRRIIEENLFPLLMHKGEDWAYEEELRATIPLSSAIFKGGRHFLPSECFVISEIVVGIRSNLEPIYFADLAERYGAKIYQAEQHPTEFKVVTALHEFSEPRSRPWEQS